MIDSYYSWRSSVWSPAAGPSRRQLSDFRRREWFSSSTRWMRRRNEEFSEEERLEEAVDRQVYPHPPSSQYLWAKDMMSDALPLPSQTTTGTGGSSFRLSRVMEMTLGPPSTIRHTNGTPWPRPATHRNTHTKWNTIELSQWNIMFVYVPINCIGDGLPTGDLIRK